ncbi:MAG TPA: xanthine dehydrogenase family protein subunit M [Burkholderiales bacterium]|jgi:carbon-monoxide dehydrogenase medium subunit|nr:xanthine dehydrogenase family protein subunit M [Burkholderiales bacterium]
MSPFELAEPSTLAQAVSLLDVENARPLSGGTALMLMMKAGVLRPARLVSLRKLALDEIRVDGDLRIGAMATLRALERSAEARAGWPAITRTLRTLSNVRVRNVATVGGALAHADPHMDLPPLLAALDSRVAIAGPRGERTVPVESLYAGYLENTLARDELITQVTIPRMGKARAAYLKCTTRSADDWPAVGIAVVVDGEDVRIVLGAATDKPVRLTAAERLLKGRAADPKALDEAAEAAAEEASIEGDLHGSAAYKKQLVRVYLKRTVHEARRPIH